MADTSMDIAMTDLQSLIRLQTWLSPAFPTGAFSYSHGLEAAIDESLVVDRTSLEEWLFDLLYAGPGWNDAVLLAESWRLSGAGEDLSDIAELAEAMSFSKERYLETVQQGSAFLKAARAWGEVPSLPEKCALPVGVGAFAAHHDVAREETLTAYLHAYISNQVQAALRLMQLGQEGGVQVLSALEKPIIETAHKAYNSSIEDLGSSSFMADIAAIKHETMTSRIFRS